jgi:tryptophan 7-halogenase
MGLSSGFLEPLESTSIHLIQAAISKLLALFPATIDAPEMASLFNSFMERQFDSIRDFIVAHYKVTARADTPFWRHCREMPIPDSLAAKLDYFRVRGEVMVENHELFRESNWFAVLYGQGLRPQNHHPLAEAMPASELAATLRNIRQAIVDRVDALPAYSPPIP